MYVFNTSHRTLADKPNQRQYASRQAAATTIWTHNLESGLVLTVDVRSGLSHKYESLWVRTGTAFKYI